MTLVSSDSDVWVDYHDLDDEGHVLTLCRFFKSAELVVVGRFVTTGDHEGNRCNGTVVGVEPSGVVAIKLDRTTLRRWQRPYH